MKKNGIRNQIRQHETFFKLMRSFLIMLVLPLTLVLVNYCYSYRLLREENLNYQDAVLQQVQLAVDGRLQGLQLHALDLTNDATLNEALSSRLAEREDVNYQLWQTSNHLTYYSASAGDLCETLIYSRYHDCLISGTYTDHRASNSLITRVGSKEMNALVLEQLQNARAYCKFELLETENGESQFLLLHTVPLWSTGQAPYGTICLQIKPEALFTGIMGESGQDGLVCLLAPNGHPAAWFGNSALVDDIPEADLSAEAFQKLDGLSHTVSHRDSAISGWRYLSIQPEHTMVHKLNQAKNLSLLMLAFILTVGTAIGFLLAHRNYEPLRHLMEEMSRQSVLLKTSPDSPTGEYNLIERSMKKMSSSMSALEDTLKEEMPRIQESVLMQLFRNAVTDYDAFQNTLQRIGILLPYQFFRIALIRRQEADMDQDQKVLSLMIIKKYTAQLVPTDLVYAFAAVDDDSLILLLNGSGDAFDSRTREILDRAAIELRGLGQMLWISASQVSTGIESVSRTYYAVTQAHFMTPEGGVYYLPEAEGACAVDKVLEGLAAQLQNYIATGSESSALDLLHRTLDAEIRQKQAALYEAQAFCIGVLNIIAGAYRLENQNVLNVNGQPPLKHLFLTQSISEMEELLSAVIHNVCAYIQENQQTPAAQLTGRMLDYIKQNYADVDLTLTSVADHFNLTSSYLSAFFKNNVGKTFLNYLTNLRMERAKELMRTTNDSIRDISEKVGYASANTFTRAFKNYEHITPSQYQESCRDDIS